MKKKSAFCQKMIQTKTTLFIVLLSLSLVSSFSLASSNKCSQQAFSEESKPVSSTSSKFEIKRYVNDDDLVSLRNKLLRNPRFSNSAFSYPPTPDHIDHARIFAIYVWALQLGISKKALKKVEIKGVPYLFVLRPNGWETFDDSIAEQTFVSAKIESDNDRATVKESPINKDQDGNSWSLYSEEPYIREITREIRDYTKDESFYSTEIEKIVQELTSSAKSKVGQKATADDRSLIWSLVKSIRALDEAADLCYIRSEGINLMAQLHGLPPENIKKIWAYGPLWHDSGAWRYHVVTALLGEDNKWYVFDTTLSKPMPVRKWLDHIKKYDLDGLMRLRVSEGLRLHPMLVPSTDYLVLAGNHKDFALLVPPIIEESRRVLGSQAMDKICKERNFYRLLSTTGNSDSLCGERRPQW